MSEVLALDSVRAGYGSSVVLDGITFSLSEGESLALLGRNGVGKTTLVTTIMGLTTLQSGTIRWRGQPFGGTPAYRRARAGLGWVPQERFMFPSLTVEEHLTVVARPGGTWGLERVYKMFPRLEERKRNYGNQLSGGEQQMLAIARALMVNPQLLLLDEPMEGLAPIIVEEILEVIGDLVRDEHTTVILVEQHARLALSVTSRAIVLDRGRIVEQAASNELLEDEARLGRLLAVN
jgi:branched-chain amino acid transport system ATP-binding protein